MKTFSLVCLAGVLAASPLRAQEPPQASPAPSPAPDTAAQADQLLKSPFVQQVLHTVVQKVLDFQGGSAGGDGKSLDLKGVTSLLSGLLGDSPEDALPSSSSSAAASGLAAYSEARLASESGQRRFDSTTRTWVTRPLGNAERTELMNRFQQDYAKLTPAEQAQWDASAGDSGSTPTLLRQWGATLGSTGGLRSGGLRSGGLTTGKLSADPLPARDFVTPTSSFSTPTTTMPSTATAAANIPPADPDEAMRRWNRQIDGQYATEQDARTAAVRQYPDLGVANSAFNAQFRARYQQYRQADPFGFLRGPGWPMKLAIFTEGDLKRQQSGTAEKP